MKHELAQLCRKHGIEPSHAPSDAAALGDLVDALQRQLDAATDDARDWKNAHALLKEQFHKQQELLKAENRQLDEAEKQEPVGWVREWEGDESDLGHLLFVQNSEDLDDSPNWFRVFPEPPNLPTLLDAARKEERDRLLFVLNNDAFIVSRNADHGSRTYQLWSQDEDEDYHVMHDKNEFFKTPIEAVDAAISHAAAIRTPQD